MFAWELGGGLGHMMQQAPLAKELAHRGHRVFVALHNLGAAETVFAGTGVCYLQAPHHLPGESAGKPRPQTLGFAQVLRNTGWKDDATLYALACAWRNLFRLVQPDLVVYDHSPTALLASRAMPMRKALIGSGFCSPPDTEPLPMFRPEGASPGATAAAARDEREVCQRANRVLRAWNWPALDRLGQMYSQTDENFLTTFRELDHFPARHSVRYWGPVTPPHTGGPPTWPSGVNPDGEHDATGTGGDQSVRPKRIFAYLKPFPALREVLTILKESPHSTLAFMPSVDSALRHEFECSKIHFAERPLDLGAVGRSCDLALLNGGHGATAEMLLAGTPVFQFPLVLEQRLTTENVQRLGVGEAGPTQAGSADEIRAKLKSLLYEAHYTGAARSFASRYTSFHRGQQVRDLVQRAEQLIFLPSRLGRTTDQEGSGDIPPRHTLETGDTVFAR